MTLAELYTAFSDYHPNADTNSRQRWLDRALKEIADEYCTYTAIQYTAVSAGTSQFDNYEVKPSVVGSTGDAVGKLLRVQFQRGDVGTISAVQDVDTYATFTSASHGLAVDDVIEIHNTQNTIGKSDGTGILAYDANNLSVAGEVGEDDYSPTTNLFTCLQTIDADAATDFTGRLAVWFKPSSNRRYTLHPMDRGEVESSLDNPVDPTSGDNPEGVLITTWKLMPPDLAWFDGDSVELPGWFLKPQHHDALAHLAAEMARTGGIGTTVQGNRGGYMVAYTPQLQRKLERIREAYAPRLPEEPMRYGRFRHATGVYSYEPRTSTAFVFNARNCW